MKALLRNILISVVMSSAAVVTAQQPSDQPAAPPQNDSNKITVRGCIRSERQNYILIADQTGAVYALQGVGNKLQGFLRKEVEVTGDIKPGSVKTGVRPEKSGSNPSDTVHGIDGVPLHVENIDKDIRVIAKHCKAGDAQ
jgi:hypothetical protein